MSDSLDRLELIAAMIHWVHMMNDGELPALGRLDGRTWMALASEPGILLTVLDGQSVFWVAGVPFRSDATCIYKIARFDKKPRD